MGYELHVQREAGLARVSLFGQTSVEEQRRWLDALVGHPDWSPGFNVLVDTRGIVDLGLPYSHARQIAAHVRQLAGLLGTGRHALVGDTDLLYGYCRMTQQLCRPCSGQIAAFRNVHQARRWLRAGHTAPAIHSRPRPQKTRGKREPDEASVERQQ
jgi:hypothetical protein